MSGRYACPQVDQVWTPAAILGRWEQVERAASEANGHTLRSREIAWTEPGYLEALARREAEYGHDLAAFVEILREHEHATGDPEAARWLHFGLCSSDVVDAGAMLGMREVTATLGGSPTDRGLASSVTGALYGVQNRISAFRTHGQVAQLGHGQARWAGLADSMLWAKRNLGRCHPNRFDGLRGPTGTGGEFTDAIRERFCARLGFDLNSPVLHGRQAADRTEWVTWLQAVARLCTVCERIATQVRLLAQTGIEEVAEPTGVNEYRGSSSMPHKRNPTRSERICGIAPMVRGMVAGYAEAASSVWDAHSLEHSSAERIAIPQVTSLTGYVLVETATVVAGLQFDDDARTRGVKQLHADSYAERNRLIREGIDGGQAWVQVRGSR